jgi:hypothetical protein
LIFTRGIPQFQVDFPSSFIYIQVLSGLRSLAYWGRLHLMTCLALLACFISKLIPTSSVSRYLLIAKARLQPIVFTNWVLIIMITLTLSTFVTVGYHLSQHFCYCWISSLSALLLLLDIISLSTFVIVWYHHSQCFC